MSHRLRRTFSGLCVWRAALALTFLIACGDDKPTAPQTGRLVVTVRFDGGAAKALAPPPRLARMALMVLTAADEILASEDLTFDSSTGTWDGEAEVDPASDLTVRVQGFARGTLYYDGEKTDVQVVSGEGTFVTVTLFKMNQEVTADFTVGPTDIITAGETITVDASGSEDTHDRTEVLDVRWDWDGDGIFDTAFSRNQQVTHTYQEPGV